MYKENKRRNAKLYRLRKKGLSYRRIAKIEGLHHTTVYEIVKRWENKHVDK